MIEALVEWILSKNFQSHENIANYYIQKVQETQGELEAINQAVKRFNQALGYCQQGGEDLAVIQLKKAVAIHPNFVKAYQLLTLIYLDTEQYSKARQSIRIAHKLDKTDEITLRYMHELNQVRKSRTAKIKEKEGKEQQTVTYNIGNETIIQPVSSSYKDNAGLHTIVNIAIGLVVGVAVMWFLIMPAITASSRIRLTARPWNSAIRSPHRRHRSAPLRRNWKITAPPARRPRAPRPLQPPHRRVTRLS